MNKIEESLNKTSVVVKVQEGLGNQLFCYAVGRALGIRQKRKSFLDAYSGYVNDLYDRSFKLGALRISPEVEIIKEAVLDPKLLDNKLNKFYPLRFRSYVKEKYVSPKAFARASFSRKQVYLDGYWQSEVYFKEIRDVLLQELVFAGKLTDTDQRVQKKIKAASSVFVHIRRVAYGQVLKRDYYAAAIKRIQERVENPYFFIFGDDLSWIRETGVFQNLPHEYVAHNDQYHELQDFELMKACQHAIVANSSFSWWAAWLINNPKKTVVAPDHSGFALEMPDSWQKIKVTY